MGKKNKLGNDIGASTRFKPGHNISSKYNADYCDMMIEYFLTERGFPTFEMFAAKIGVISETLRNWAGKYKRFGEAYARCTDIQKGRLISGAVGGLYNSNFAKFVAVNCHGMKDKAENDSTVTFNIELSDEIDEESN